MLDRRNCRDVYECIFVVLLSKAQGICKSDKRKKSESFQKGGSRLDQRNVFLHGCQQEGTAEAIAL